MSHSFISTEGEMPQVKTGSLCLISDDRVGRQQLTATVYRNTPSPFAIFSQESRKMLGGQNAAYLALSDCEVKPMDEKTFMFTSKKERVGKGPSYLIFETNSKEERDSWVQLLKCDDVKVSKITRCSGFLPTIEEYEDVEELQTSHRITRKKANLIPV